MKAITAEVDSNEREDQLEELAQEIANSEEVPTPLITSAVYNNQLSPKEAFNLACSVAEYLADKVVLA